ncbi:MAG TPA: hypothetical protein VKN76_14400 [Kiloniellaceae bacterium]|nr:hypothetical protein [Kiloniellaceae bacterium]
MISKKSVGAAVLAATIALLAPTGQAGAESMDGSENLICFAESTSHCQYGGRCENLRAAELDLPRFFRLDFTAMTVSRKTGEDTERSSKIASLTHSEDGLLLQGTDEGLGWTLMVAPDGDMSVSATRAGETFVIFGACASS